ncbi:MAG TPA: low-specificity L-threonine aldolase [Desulfobacteraceae bacterium]|jgi:threonine aldolase|nr:low-specificity L-threonine aldolase [Desulfobacteraceae bacterium]
MRRIDLRSDTVTLPTDSMRRAIAEAELGDDVFGEDPTVNRLEERAAELSGKEAALFVASGTMANLVCELTHCGRGDEMILGDQSHILHYEQGGCAALGGIHPRAVRNLPDGTLPLDEVEAVVRDDNVHFPRTKLVVVENTHNRCNGMPLDAAYMAGIGSLVRRFGLKLHVDGARIFNAAVALGVPAAELASEADSIVFCLSKGLAAPAGALVCGPSDFIAEARRNRKILGGGMRQAGVLAAAGLVALDEMIDRLAEDHANARRLAEGLCEIPGVVIDLSFVKTNIVFMDLAENLPDAPEFASMLAAEGLLILPLGPGKLRAVTHYRITSEDIEEALVVFKRVCSLAGN